MQPMPQQQMAFQAPPNFPPQYAAQSQHSGQPQVAWQQPTGMEAYGQPPMMSQSAQMPPMANSSVPMTQPFNPMMPFGIGGGVTSPPSTMSGEGIPFNNGIPNIPTDSTQIATPAPVPDPAFSSNGSASPPVTSVSSTQVVDSDVAEIEAF